MKRCTSCRLQKSFTEFNKDSYKKNGLKSSCKYCEAIRYKQYSAQNANRIAIKNRTKMQSIHYRFMKAKNTALRRKITWTINEIEYERLISSLCVYCDGNLGDKVIYGCGLDRIDCTKGYEIHNAVPCCWKCNTIKSDILSFKETKAVIALVLEMRNKKAPPA